MHIDAQDVLQVCLSDYETLALLLEWRRVREGWGAWVHEVIEDACITIWMSQLRATVLCTYTVDLV